MTPIFTKEFEMSFNLDNSLEIGLRNGYKKGRRFCQESFETAMDIYSGRYTIEGDLGDPEVLIIRGHTGGTLKLQMGPIFVAGHLTYLED